MRDAPHIAAFKSKELCTGHIEDLPSIEPHSGVVLPICIFEVRPYFILACIHLRQPILSPTLAYEILGVEGSKAAYLTRPRIMLPIYPPLLLQPKIILEIKK